MQNLQIVDEANALFLGKFKKFSSLFLSLSCLLGFLLIFILTGCGGGNKDNNNLASVVYTINFYDDNLDLSQSIVVPSKEVNLAQLITDYGLPTPLYEGNSSVDISTYTNYSITGSTNLYATQGIQEIRTETELAAINTDFVTLSGKYVLLNDIVLDTTLDETKGWLPIGNETNEFTGIFNGNNHIISNLWIDAYSYIGYIGLFGHIRDAQIKNIGVEIDDLNGGVKGYGFVGGVAGAINNSSIISSYSIGKVGEEEDIYGSALVGGVAGYVSNGSSVINSYSIGDVRGDDQVGGVVGMAEYDSNIINSYSVGNVYGDNQFIGGVVGYTRYNTNITNSYSIGDVRGGGFSHFVGGVVGIAQHDSSVINSYSIGNINGYYFVGGIAGSGDHYERIQYNVAINPSVNGNYEYEVVNRVVGLNDVGTASDNFALEDMLVNGNTVSDDTDNGEGKSEAELKTKSTYQSLGWGFGDDNANPWKIDANKNNGFPYFYWQE
ncbi:MAG: hypothetical protein LBI78_04045 [Campylobacteraceae bacterium]|nr:hypothetical protein [Campylobacteraceae bacterium]